jgi:hypothetical protein
MNGRQGHKKKVREKQRLKEGRKERRRNMDKVIKMNLSDISD